MTKVLSTFAVFLFVLVAGLNPYVSSCGAAVAATQKAEADLNYQPLEEEVHETPGLNFVIQVTELPNSYPDLVQLKPQHDPTFLLRPPSGVVS